MTVESRCPWCREIMTLENLRQLQLSMTGSIVCRSCEKKQNNLKAVSAKLRKRIRDDIEVFQSELLKYADGQFEAIAVAEYAPETICCPSCGQPVPAPQEYPFVATPLCTECSAQEKKVNAHDRHVKNTLQAIVDSKAALIDQFIQSLNNELNERLQTIRRLNV